MSVICVNSEFFLLKTLLSLFVYGTLTSIAFNFRIMI
jgi:hypothetical protein